MGNPGKAKLYTEDLFYPFCTTGAGLRTTRTESAVLLPSKSSHALFSKSYSLHLRAVSKYQSQENFCTKIRSGRMVSRVVWAS